VISIVITVLAILVMVPVLTFSLQCFLSFLPVRRATDLHESKSHPRTTVLIPAHNERDIIGGIIGDVTSQLHSGDRAIVIADNCDDDTAEVSKGFGAEVIERTNLEQRGKSYALQYALNLLSEEQVLPEVIIVVDADCRISSQAISALSSKVGETNRPVQGSYIFGGLKGSATSNLASSFTLWFKNHIRPLGSLRAGMPCQLTGSGMAFPWEVIRKVGHAG